MTHAPSIESDHFPITCKLKIKKADCHRKIVSYRKTKNINIDKLREDIVNSNLQEINKNSVDEIVDQFNYVLSDLTEKHAPLITKEICVRPRKPWYTDDITKAKQKRRAAERRYLKTKDRDDLNTLRKARLQVTEMCKVAKRNFYQQKITENVGDQNVLFKLVNDLLYRVKDTSLPSADSQEELANRIADFFANKIEKIVSSFVINESYVPTIIKTSLAFLSPNSNQYQKRN